MWLHVAWKNTNHLFYDFRFHITFMFFLLFFPYPNFLSPLPDLFFKFRPRPLFSRHFLTTPLCSSSITRTGQSHHDTVLGRRLATPPAIFTPLPHILLQKHFPFTSDEAAVTAKRQELTILDSFYIFISLVLSREAHFYNQ